MTPEQFQSHYLQVQQAISSVVVGQPELIDHVLCALLARGHILIEGVPGLGKTLLVKALSRALACDFKRIQFTPDLMPSDVTGGNVFNQQEERFVFNPGPVFTQLLLADELNRAPAKTQSALLEAMQERSVTSDGVTRPLPHPFIVIATQNPVESHGTYPLPEAQLDRFLLKVTVDYPSLESEIRFMEHHLAGFDPNHLPSEALTRVLDVPRLERMQQAVRSVAVHPSIIHYTATLVAATRKHQAVYVGASPRASLALLDAARARALTLCRGFVIPDDIKHFAAAVLRHRLILHADAELDGLTADDCVQQLLERVPVPGASLDEGVTAPGS